MIRFLLFALLGCNPAPDAADLEGTRGGRIDVYFNDPGTRPDNLWDPDMVAVMVELIDQSNATLDFAVMGFSNTAIIEAVVRAFDRGVKVRMVGDAGHMTNRGYQRMYDRHIPIVVGNQQHIMHNKFMVVDGRFVFASTANWSDSDLKLNSNNGLLMDSPPIAKDFTIQFEQMFSGVFGYNKEIDENPRIYQVGDTTVEIWFSPTEDAMGRILEYVDAAEESVRFCIFAFTKDQLGSLLVRKMEEFRERDIAEGVDMELDFRDRRSVAGVIDQSQLHSNGQYHEVYRLLSAGVPVRMDANDNTSHPGDYQAGGGRLHSKTMLVDADTDNPAVLTGSFNWSAAATGANDEYLIVLKSPRIAKAYKDYWETLWFDGRELGRTFIGEDVEPGDIVINEVMWYGVNEGDEDGFDEFIELRNRTDRDIRLDLWQLSNELDVVVGLPPGSVIPANGYFTILDHTLEVYTDGAPQDQLSAFSNGDLVLNPFNDNRQARLYLKDGSFELHLRDTRGVEMDSAGDGGAAFAGGPDGSKVRSMERTSNPGDGSDPDNWHACSLSTGGANVNPDYRGSIIATPGEDNSDG